MSAAVLWWYRGVRRREPARAEAIRRRAAWASGGLARLVERLPERWTSGLYLPDFEEPAELPEKMKTDPFERLAARNRDEEGAAGA